MTKIKNTKKGMAKKTLSMSLVVAMLATSNVPVWAAEFSDGTDAAVETEAPAAETFSDEAEQAPVVEDNTDVVAAKEATSLNDSFSVTPEIKEVDAVNKTVTWENVKNVKATFTITKKDGIDDTGLKFYYVWKVNGQADTAATEITDKYNAQTVTAPELTGAAAGKELTLFIYAEANDGSTAWSYTSDAYSITAVDKTSEMANFVLSDTFKANAVYDGKDHVAKASDVLTAKDGTAIDTAAYNVVVSGNTKDVTGEDITVTITPKAAGVTGQKVLTYQISAATLTDNTDITKHLEASLETKEFAYTGSAIKLKASDVKVIDKDSKDDLSNYLKEDEDKYVGTIAGTDIGEYKASLNLIKGQPEKGLKNYSIADGKTLATTNTTKIVARDLSSVVVTIAPHATPDSGKELTASDLTYTFKDAKTGETLALTSSKDVDIVVPAGVKGTGSYTVEIKAKQNQKNVTGSTTATLKVVGADLSTAEFVASAYKDKSKNVLADEEYTGEAVTKSADKLGSLKVGGLNISEDQYTIEYADNTNAGTAKLIVKGKNSFEGSQAEFTFTINPATVTNNTIKANKSVEVKDTQKADDYKDALGLVVKAKNATTPTPKEFTLKEGTDYTVKYSYKNDTKTVGGSIVATITLTNKNFTTSEKELKVEVPIKARALKSENIKLKENSFTYTGSAVTPDFDVVVDGRVMPKGNFDTVYTNNINAGTATISVTPKARMGFDESTTAKLTFEIKPADASSLVGVIGSKQYTGYSLDVNPADINLKLGNSTVDVASNFKLTFGENLKIGQGTVTLTPKNGNFTGTKTLTFDIVGKLVSATDAIKTYDDKGIITTTGFTYDGTAHTYAKVVADIKDDTNKKLVEGTDYDLVYIDNVYGKSNKGAILAIAKGNYGGNLTTTDGTTVVKGVYTDAEGNKTANVIAIKQFDITPISDITTSNVVVKNAVYAGGLSVKPDVFVTYKGTTLVEGKDYTLDFTGSKDLVNATTGKTNMVTIKFKNGYAGTISNQAWGIDKFNLANADVTVDGDKVTVKCGRLDVETSEYTVETKDDKVTVTAKKDSKNYTGSKTVDKTTQDQKPGTPMISSVKVVGNKATAILSGDTEGAAGYDYVISTDRDCITNKNYDSISKNQVQTSTTFKYVQQGTYYAYCHAWKRDENGKKVFSDWSNAYPFVVSAITPDAPVITNVTVSGSTIKVTYKAAANATGYDVVLGTSSKKENGETRPYNYGDHKVLNLKEGTVTATFKNVPKGTWVVGMHAFNRTSEDGKKVFSPWSNLKKAIVK